MTATPDKIEVLPASILWSVAIACIVVGFVFGLLLVVLSMPTFPGIGWHHFEADRACRPGMVSELLPDGRAICVGGDGETWVVRYR